MTQRVLVQTSIRFAEDDWNVGRFSLLQRTIGGMPGVTVFARDRAPGPDGEDPVLVGLSRADFDQIWVFGVDGGSDGLTAREQEAIVRFHDDGGGVLATRDHQDMGAWLRGCGDLGAVHFFHRADYAEPDPERWCVDDLDTPAISWPNYHSGRNGDWQPITVIEPVHPLLVDTDRGGRPLDRLPAHPHEGAVGPGGIPRAREIARGTSRTSGHTFSLSVVLDRDADHPGRAVAESSFHHFADYNWDPRRGAPSFVIEPTGTGMLDDPEARRQVERYVHNLVAWLAPA